MTNPRVLFYQLLFLALLLGIGYVFFFSETEDPFEKLLKDIRDPEFEVRQQALHKAKTFPSHAKELIPLLSLRLTENPVKPEKPLLLETLAFLASSESIPSFLNQKLFFESAEEARIWILLAPSFPTEISSALTPLLTSSAPELRIIGLEVLLQFSSKERLLKISEWLPLVQDPEPQVQLKAVELLLKGPREETRLTQTLFETTRASFGKVRALAIGGLDVFYTPEALSRLLEALGDEETIVRQSAVSTLIRLGKKAPSLFEKLIAPLGTGDPIVCYELLQVLGSFEPSTIQAHPALLPQLIFLLTQSDEFLQQKAVELLGIYGKSAREAQPVLLKQLEKKPTGLLLKNLLLCLGALQTPETIPFLLPYLKHSEPMIQTIAQQALEETGKAHLPSLLPHLFKALEDSDERMRIASLKLIVALSPKISLPSLIKALSDESYPVRLQSIKLLGQLGPESAPALEELIYALRRTPEEQIQKEILRTLEQLSLPELIPLLEALIETEGFALKEETRSLLEKLRSLSK